VSGRLPAILLLLGASAGLGACGLFGDEDEVEPAELVDIDNRIEVRRAWRDKLGADAEFLRLGLRPAGDGRRIYAAGADGKVAAYEPAAGDQVWEVDLETDLSAGPGVGGGFVAVVTTNGEVVVLDAASGAEQWRAFLDGEALAAPLVGNGVVVVQTVDNQLRALDLFDDGRERWTVLQSMPALTVRGTATPVFAGSAVVSGFDNGRVVAVDVDTGTTEWEALLAPPTGRSDLERLSDIDGLLAVVGQDIYAAGYQGRLGSVAVESGQVLWGVEVSSLEGVSADWNSVYTVQDEGVILSLSRRTGAENWRQDVLLRREPTLPIPFNTTVMVGDFEGYLHFFSNVDGEYVARVRVDSAAISNPPIVVGNLLYVQTDGGEIVAYRIEEPDQPGDAPAIADDPDEGG